MDHHNTSIKQKNVKIEHPTTTTTNLIGKMHMESQANLQKTYLLQARKWLQCCSEI
jgi:hypothetical protein